MKGPKLDPPGGTTFDFKGVHFLTPLETRFLCMKWGQNWTLQGLRCSNVGTHQTNTEASPPQLLLVTASTLNEKICHNEGAKTFKGVHFLTPLETRFLCTGVQNWTLNRLNPVPPCRSGFKPIQAPSSAALFQCRNASNQHRVGNKSLEQGRPQLRLQKSYQFQVPKTNPQN